MWVGLGSGLRSPATQGGGMAAVTAALDELVGEDSARAAAVSHATCTVCEQSQFGFSLALAHPLGKHASLCVFGA